MIVGLTGGIGSGKTWISSLFKDLGIPIYISDIEAKKIMHLNKEVKNSIIKLFGDQAYEKGQLNRDLISKMVFSNKDLLNQLNKIVHPAVDLHFKNWYANQNSPFVIKESAIIFEIGAEKKCDATILIIAPKEIRIKRIQQRDHISVKAIELRMNNQWDDKKKIPLADYIIENMDKNQTLLKVKQVYNSIINI